MESPGGNLGAFFHGTALPFFPVNANTVSAIDPETSRFGTGERNA